MLLLNSPRLFAVDVVNSRQALPLLSRMEIAGTSGTATFGQGDLMVPLWGTSSQFLYSDILAKMGDDNAYLISMGLGVRGIANGNTILGAYFFGDYNKSPNSNYFTILNPGLEFMTNAWDGHFNGYVPVGPTVITMQRLTGTQVGQPNTYFFERHTEYQVLYDNIEDVGPGFDLEVGRTFSSLKRLHLFGGGYYFAPQYTESITGVEAGVDVPLKYKWATAEARDSYDNVRKNTFTLTLRVTIGGPDKTGSPEIHDRLLDRIPRHIADLSTGDGIPSQTKIVDRDSRAVIMDNIWFFHPDSGGISNVRLPDGFESCTFEHPCVGLTQARIDQINAISPNANFFLSPGTYNNPNLGLGYNINMGQRVYGRTSNYLQLATGTERALINDTLTLNGLNNLYNLRVNGQSVKILETGGLLQPFQVGVLTAPTAVGNNNIYNSDIVSQTSLVNSIGVANNANGDTLSIYNSNVSSIITNEDSSISIAAGNLRSGVFNIYNSNLFSSNSETTNTFSIAFGFVNNEIGMVNISNTSISANLLHGGLVAGILNNASLGTGEGTINLTGSNISATGDDISISAGILNQSNNPSGMSANVNILNSNISAASTNSPGGTTTSVFTTGTGVVTIDSSRIASSGDSGSVFGIFVDTTATLNYKNTIIAINLSGTAIGAPIVNLGTLNDNGGNQCYQNGAPVPC